jgi:uncharacterized protein YbaP (TraB family)
MPFIPSVIKWINTKRLSQIDLFRKYPAESQQEVLTRLMQGAGIPSGAENTVMQLWKAMNSSAIMCRYRHTRI